jgi:hypothetical protein
MLNLAVTEIVSIGFGFFMAGGGTHAAQKSAILVDNLHPDHAFGSSGRR